MNNKNIEEILKKLGGQDVPDNIRQLAEETTEKFFRTLEPAKEHILWRYIMKSPITKLAAAVVIVIGIIIAGSFFIEMGGSVALGSVLERIEQAQAFMYKMKMTTTGAMMQGMPAVKSEMEGTVTISTEYGMKMEMTTMIDTNNPQKITQQMYVLPDQKAMIMVMPEQKKYMRMEFDDDMLAKMKKQSNDPRDMVKQILNCKYTDLGRSTIDGVEVEGFETTDPAYAGGAVENLKVRLWVDVKSRLPVRTEMDYKMNNQMEISGAIYDYQWDVQLDAKEFEPKIPADYELAAEMKMPSLTEEAAIEGLKFFADMIGHYPKSLNLMDLLQGKENGPNPTAAGLKLKEEMDRMTKEERTKKGLEMIRPIQSLGMFYMMLVKDRKEPAYYGDKVTPEFGHAVLLRWKTGENQYKVIFGDLTTEEVNAERLAELEAAPLNMNPYAIKPQPADGATAGDINNLQLSWMPGKDAVQHLVYFGSDANNLSLLAEVTEPNFAGQHALERGTKYYWRVDEVQTDGSVETGDVWSFNTGGLVGWWEFDNGADTIAVDSSGNRHEGTLTNMDANSCWVEGKYGKALYFDGSDDYVSIPALNLNSDTVTILAWIKRDGSQSDWTGVVFSADGGTIAGINLTENKLRYHWNGRSWQWVSGLAVPDNQWVLVGLAVEPAKATMYIGQDGGVSSATNTGPHSQEGFGGTTRIGHDTQAPEMGPRFFKGAMDDVRIYNYTLSEAEVTEVYKSELSVSSR